MAAAFAVAQQSGALVAAAPRLTTAATPGELAAHRRQDRRRPQGLRGATDGALEGLGGEDAALAADPRAGRRADRQHRGDRGLDVGALRPGRAAAGAAGTGVAARRVDRLLVPLIDDQLFYAMTGYRNARRAAGPASRGISRKRRFSRYRHLAELRADATIGAQLLATAFNVSDAALLEPLRERFEAAARGIERRLSQLGTERPCAGNWRRPSPAWSSWAPDPMAVSACAPERSPSNNGREISLRATAISPSNSWPRPRAWSAPPAPAPKRPPAPRPTPSSAGRNLLLLISAVSIVGAALIAWLFVGRVLSRRLGRLSDRMRGMAEGDLEGRSRSAAATRWRIWPPRSRSSAATPSRSSA